MRNPPIEIDAAEKYPHAENKETREKTSQHNIKRGSAICLRPRGKGEREILLIQQSITTYSLLQGISKGDFQ